MFARMLTVAPLSRTKQLRGIFPRVTVLVDPLLDLCEIDGKICLIQGETWSSVLGALLLSEMFDSLLLFEVSSSLLLFEVFDFWAKVPSAYAKRKDVDSASYWGRADVFWLSHLSVVGIVLGIRSSVFSFGRSENPVRIQIDEIVSWLLSTLISCSLSQCELRMSDGPPRNE